MNAAKHIISEALTPFIQYCLFLLAVFTGFEVQGYEAAIIMAVASASLIIAYNDWKEKKHRE